MARKAVRMGWVPIISRAKSIMAKSPRIQIYGNMLTSPTTGRAKVFDHSVRQIGGRWRRISVLVFKIHRLPLELAHLVERLYLDPLDVLHRRDESGDPFDIGGGVRNARDHGETHPHGLV